MEPAVRFVEQHWNTLLVPFSVVGITILAGFAIRNFIFGRLRRWAAARKSMLDDVIVQALRGPFMIWVLPYRLCVLKAASAGTYRKLSRYPEFQWRCVEADA